MRSSFAAVIAAFLAAFATVQAADALAQTPSLEQLLTLPAEEGGALPGAPRPAAEPVLEEDHTVLADYVALRLRPAPLVAPAGPADRIGHGDMAIKLPVKGPLHLRTGVRVDYRNRPADASWELGGTPTLGFGGRF